MCKEKEEAVYLEQKQSRNTHPEKSAGALLSETCTREEIQITYMGALFLGLFFWPIVLLWVILSLYQVYLRVLHCVHMCISQTRWISVKRPMGRLPSLQVCLSMCSREGLLDLKNEKYVISFIRPQLLLFFVLKYLSMGDKLQLFSLGPIFHRPYFIDPVIKPLPHEGRENISSSKI